MARKITPTHVLLNQIELSSSASSVTFSNIPQGYGDLVLVSESKSNSTLENIYLNLNGDTTGSNYNYVLMLGTGSSAISASYNALTWGETDTTGAINTYHFMDYSATDKHKTCIFKVSRPAGGVLGQAGRWSNTAAIASITLKMGLSQSFQADSIFSLYGVYA